MGSYDRTGNKYVSSYVTRLSFGKHKGETVGWVIENDPKWLQWALDNVKWFAISKRCVRELAENLNILAESEVNEDEEEAFKYGYASDIGDR